jgi:hypothetical protein
MRLALVADHVQEQMLFGFFYFVSINTINTILMSESYTAWPTCAMCEFFRLQTILDYITSKE